VTTLEQRVLKGVREVLGDPRDGIALHEPELGSVETARLQDCIESGYVSSVGEYVGRFERMLCAYTGAGYAVAVVNGTAALQVALRLVGVEMGDEVLVPSLSFVATANAIVHVGAIPHFVDSDSYTIGLSPSALDEHLASVVERTPHGLRNRQTGRRVAAVVPMHAFGHPVDMEGLLSVTERLGLPIVEDAAEALGSTYRNRHMGTFGVLGTLSFNGNKIVTTGGGGAILTDDAQLAARAKHLTTTAKRPHRWEFFHDEVAWNYRLPNLNAALGCAQMERLPSFLGRKRLLSQRYQRVFANTVGVEFIAEPAFCRSNYWLNTIRLNSAESGTRDRVLAVLNDAGYQSRPVWNLLHELPMFAHCPRAGLSTARRLAATLINLPSSAKLGGPPL
jgi:perosamine synthetase